MITIDTRTRQVTIPKEDAIFGVMNDKDSEIRRFKMDRITAAGVDLSEYSFRINFAADGVVTRYGVADATADDMSITFSWLIDSVVTRKPGKIPFVVCAATFNDDGTVKNEWNSTIAYATILDGLEPEIDEIDVPEDVKIDLQSYLDRAESAAVRAEVAADRAEQAEMDASGASAGDVPTADGIGGWMWKPQSGSTESDSLPDYIISDLYAGIQRLQDLDAPNRFSFGFATDLHFSALGSGYNEDKLRTPIILMMKEAELLSRMRTLSTFVLGGDYQQQWQPSSGKQTKQQGIDVLYDVNALMSKLDCHSIALPGNHETNYSGSGEGYGLTDDEIYCLLGKKYIRGPVKRAGDQVFYQVDELNGVSYLFLSGKTISEANVNAWSMQMQMQNIEESAAAYPFIIFNHYSGHLPADNDPAGYYIYDGVKYLIDGLKQLGISVLAWIGGHNHGDWCVEYQGVPVFSCLQSGFWTSNPSQDGVTYQHTANTATESALSVFTVDKAENKIWCTRFGLGVDRVWEQTSINWLFRGIDHDGSLYAGVGYENLNKRLADSFEAPEGEYVFGSATVTLTGFIPVKAGDTVRFENIPMPTNTTSRKWLIGVFDASFNMIDTLRPQYWVNHTELRTVMEPITEGDNMIGFIAVGSDIAYFRFNCEPVDENAAIVIGK